MIPELFEIPLTEVKITRRRERKDLGDLEELAASVLRVGQLQPIVVDDNNELVAGERRINAFMLNGAVTILAIRKKDVTEDMAKEMELEENLQRKNFTLEEQVRGLAELDRLRRVRDPNWTQVQTAVAAGGKTSQRDVSQAIQLTKMMDLFPEIAKATSINQALNMAKAKATNIGRILDVQAQPENFAEIESKIWLGDSTEVIRGLDDEMFHAIVTDPPFGVDYDQRVAGTIGDASAYEDSKELYLKILGMAPEMYRVLKPKGFVVFFFGMSWYREVVDAFEKAGFSVDPIPLIWDRTDGRTFTNCPDHLFAKGYDVALHAWKGEAKFAKQGRHNVFRIPPVPTHEREMLVERPVELYAELIKHLTIPGEVVADFFAGSGSCPAAAHSLGRDFFAVEKNPERRAAAIQKTKAYAPSK